MEKLEFQKRIALGKRLAQQSQAQIMSEISQFTHTEHIDGPAYHPTPDRMLYAAGFYPEPGMRRYLIWNAAHMQMHARIFCWTVRIADRSI